MRFKFILNKLFYKVFNRLKLIKINIIKSYYKISVLINLRTEIKPCILCENNKEFSLLFKNDRYNLPIKIQRCNKCNLVTIRPTPTSKFVNKFYSSRMYRGLYMGVLKPPKLYLNEAFNRAKKHVFFIRKFIKRKNIHILDFGCSDGIFLVEFKREYNLSKLYGLEPSNNFLGHCERYIDEIYKDIYNIPKNKKFDIVTLWHVLEHLLDPIKTLSKLKHHLKKDSLLFIEVPDFNRAIGLKNIHIGHLYYFDRKTIKQVLEKAGFHIIKIY